MLSSTYLFVDIRRILPEEIREDAPLFPIHSDQVEMVETEGVFRMDILLDELSQYLEENPEKVSLYSKTGSYCALIEARAQCEQDHIEIAFSRYKLAKLLAPNDCIVLSEYAAMLRLVGQSDQALLEYEEFIEKADPEQWKETFIEAARTSKFCGNIDLSYQILTRIEPYCNDDESFISLHESLDKELNILKKAELQKKHISISNIGSLVRHLSLEINLLGFSVIAPSGIMTDKKSDIALTWWDDQIDADKDLFLSALMMMASPFFVMNIHRISSDRIETMFTIVLSDPNLEKRILILSHDNDEYYFEWVAEYQEAIHRIIGVENSDPTRLGTTEILIRTFNNTGKVQERQIVFTGYQEIIVMSGIKEQFKVISPDSFQTLLFEILTSLGTFHECLS